MANYVVSNLMAGTQQNLASGGKTLIEAHAVTAGRRYGLYEFEFGIDGQPNNTDCSIDWIVGRTTGAGTGTAATLLPLDPADTATASTVANVNHTAEPTYTAANTVWSIGANQRASYRWIAKDDKSFLWVAATNLAGLALYAKSVTYASTAMGTFYIQEQ